MGGRKRGANMFYEGNGLLFSPRAAIALLFCSAILFFSHLVVLRRRLHGREEGKLSMVG